MVQDFGIWRQSEKSVNRLTVNLKIRGIWNSSKLQKREFERPHTVKPLSGNNLVNVVVETA